MNVLMMKSMKTTRLIVMYTVPLDYHKDLTYEEKEHKWGILQFLFGFIKNSKQWLNTE